MTSQYGAHALHVLQARPHAHMRMHTAGHTQARTRAHIHKYAIFIAFTRQQ